MTDDDNDGTISWPRCPNCLALLEVRERMRCPDCGLVVLA